MTQATIEQKAKRKRLFVDLVKAVSEDAIPTRDQMPKADISDILRNYQHTMVPADDQY